MMLTAKDGCNLTPRGRKAQALIALLAMAPRGQRTRVWLRDKLWSTSDEKKSSSSLRQTVFEIKREFGDLADHIFQIDRNALTLKLDKVWVDLIAVRQDVSLCAQLGIKQETELLEGIDVGDEEFEDWLAFERQIWADFAEDIPHKIRHATPKRITESQEKVDEIIPIYSLGYLPNIQHGCDEYTRYIADYILEGVAKNLTEFQPVKIFDFREPSGHSSHLNGACETEYCIRIRTLQIHRNITITLFLYKTSQMSLEWSQSIELPVDELITQNSPVLSGFISQNVDRLAKSIFEDRQFEHDPIKAARRAGYTALNMMFKLDETALLNSHEILDSAYKNFPNSIYPALQSYVLSFQLGENLGDLKSDATKQTQEIVNATLKGNPFNSIALASLAHVMGYVFRDHDSANELIARAIHLNASQAFVWDHLALNKIYTGDFEAAYKAAKQAVYLGAYSPISYSYDTTLSMAATMIGRHNEAIVAGQSAIAKQPRFAAAMRYLVANLGHAGKSEQAREVYQKLLLIDPDFQDQKIQKERFRLTASNAEQFVLDGITRAEY